MMCSMSCRDRQLWQGRTIQSGRPTLPVTDCPPSFIHQPGNTGSLYGPQMPSTNTPSLLYTVSGLAQPPWESGQCKPHLNDMASAGPSNNCQPMPRLLNRRRRFQRSVHRARGNNAPSTDGSKPPSICVDDSTPDSDTLGETHLLCGPLRQPMADGNACGDDLLSLRRVYRANLFVLAVD